MQIILSHYRFTLRDPYQAGQRLTPIEAQVLNALRAENIRNTARRKWQRAIGVLSSEEETELSQLITKLDEDYQFSPPGPPRSSTFESLCDHLATEAVSASLRKEGITVDERRFRELVQGCSQREDIKEAAREQLRVRQQIAESSLEDLL
jgi:hypothetical protein